ncbi:roadblock/LC7 domain-containing protein [Acrocarpospora catenulata]|uniref:roadblock/LC7 domain-containing protein n=1 Tax=Acrocarpospora catenulata TaxID=2836182 RepID=UPI001BDA5386|nr:roadblock/LC7 domain-containing protein [Acrocarpospora catenulata]
MIGIEECLAEAMAIPGALCAMLVDHASGTAIAGQGAADLEGSAAGLRECYRATQGGLAMSSPDGTVRIEDVIVTTDHGYQLILPMETPFDGPLLMCLRLDRGRANLALARLRLRSISHQLIAP